MMMSRYHSKISQKATYLRVYENNRMLYGEEVTGIIHNLEERIVELENLLKEFRPRNEDGDGWDFVYDEGSEYLGEAVLKALKEEI
jgi:hypothetical protein